MWLSKPSLTGKFICTVLSIIVTTALLGCGFRPLYAPPAGTSAEDSAAVRLAAVHVDPIANREGQLLRNELVDLLDPGRHQADTDYNLQVTLKYRQSDLAYEDTGFATRANLRIDARYVLVQQSSGTPLTTGLSRVVTSYNLTDSFFSAYTTAESERHRAVKQIAHDIRRRLAAYFISNPKSLEDGAVPQAPTPVDG